MQQPPDSEPSCSGRSEPAPVPHAAKAWAWFNSIGAPKYHVAPMVDQSELPFRLVCRRNGSTCAYTPMLHARIFSQDQKYRDECWTTCSEDRPLMVQFCANDPQYLIKAAHMVAPYCDAVDINFGCPQRIAKRGNYGAFLMDDWKTVESLVRELSQSLSIPVTCKIRVFPDVEKTVAYARMIEAAGCQLLAVHGRLREQKDNTATRADWDKIRAVREALSIPVLGNGNIQTLADAHRLMEETGVVGVLSAESLLADPALFSPARLSQDGAYTNVDVIRLSREYLDLVAQHPVPMRMVRGHMHNMLGKWLTEYTHIRDIFNVPRPDLQAYMAAVDELRSLVAASGRCEPQPRISAKELAAMEREAAKAAAIEEQERESAALDALEAQTAALSCGDGCELASAAAGHGEVPGDDDIELVLDWSEAGHAQGLTGPTEWLDEAHQSVGLPASVDGQADASILADPSVAAGEAGESAVSAQEVVSVQA